MSQGPIATQNNVLVPSRQVKPALGDSEGNTTVSGVGGSASKLYITGAPVVVKASPGMIVRVNVITAGSAGTINDCATTAAIATANEVAVIPATVGPVVLEFPCLVGITVAPGSSQVVSVSYQ